MKRRLRRAKIKFLSLVPRGANRLPTILKDDGAFEVALLTKDMTDNGELHAIVYAPEFRDSQGDIASAAVIKDMAYDAAKHGVEIDVRHDNKPVGRDRAFVAESFIVQKADPRFADMRDYSGKLIDSERSWGVVIKIDDPELRKSYQNGSWKGVSMGGVAEVEHEKEQDVAERVAEALAKKLGLTKPNHEENDMALTQEDIQKITDGVVASMSKQVDEKAKADAEAVKLQKAADEKAKAADEDPSKPPVFKGDPTSVEDVKKHQAALRKHSLMADVDWSDPESVAKLQETLAAETSDDPKAAEIASLQKQIDTLLGRSNQPQGDKINKQGNDEIFVGVDKEMQKAAAAGLAMAKFSNTSRGF